MPPSKNESIIEVKNLAARFDDNIVFENVNFQVRKGEILVVVGESGCGKSTLLKIMIGLHKPYAGSVFFQGMDIVRADEDQLQAYRQNIGVLFQSSALFSSMRLRENIALPLQEYTDLDAAMIDSIIRMKLAMVNLAGYENHYPSELSGGMKKRAGIARAIALDPLVLFFDELSAGLDPVTAVELDDLIIKTNEALGTTMVIVTHELESICNIAHRVVMLDKSARGIIASGTPQELKEKSKDPRVRSFFLRQMPEA
ncbi:MAG TPA: ATP-binding cassette domain-containing protein [Smithellaceae bacterium]|nr:ATP-binding cassette domain-containing protein [Smithellaceae bacterium]HRS89438.1 ATP-binding cassette domain-containing protein [Smithellaceae bacterium]HRV26153.1 ATP-binding cassette domain-containing protein [Smithellaceae bacterium]